MKLRLGIVILNYNDYKTTLNLINQIKYYDEIDHIVVVDNKSTNNSLEMLKEANDNTWYLIASPENKGYASGNNIGIRYLINNFNIDIIGIVNPDVMFTNNFVYQIKQTFIEKKDYAIITGLQLKPDGSINKSAYWKDATISRLLISNSYILSKIENMFNDAISKQMKNEGKIITVASIEGSCFFIRTKDMQRIGLFDENTFLFCEEGILAKKLKKINRKIGVNKEITFIHNHSTTMKKVFSKIKITKIMLKSKRYFLINYISNVWWAKLLYDITSITCILEEIFIVYPYYKIKNSIIKMLKKRISII